MKDRGIHWPVGFDFIDDDPLFVRRALPPRLNRGSHEYTGGLLVIAKVSLDFLVGTVLGSLRQNSNL